MTVIDNNMNYQESMDYVESLRKKYARDIVLCVITFIATFCSLFYRKTEVTVGLFIVFLIIIIFFLIPHRKKYEKQYKEKLVKHALNEYFDDLVFEPSGCISRETIAKMDMMCLGNIYKGNDFIKGKYNDIDFTSCDLYIADESTDSDGNSSTTVYFHGKWMIFDFNKNFKYNLQICEKGFAYSKRTKATGKMTKVKMESDVFNKSFNVYASSELEAFYIITPHIMSNLMNLSINVKGKTLLCFHNNKIHIGVNNGIDSFEPSAFNPVTTHQIKKSILNEINMITGFVEELRIDKKLWVNT